MYMVFTHARSHLRARICARACSPVAQDLFDVLLMFLCEPSEVLPTNLVWIIYLHVCILYDGDYGNRISSPT